jgi:putative transposase
MRSNPRKFNRRSIRLKGYDYSQPGAYYITICTYQRQCLFGKVEHQEMVLNESGRIVWQCWQDLPNHYAHVCLDEFTIMPNHLHGILILMEIDPPIGDPTTEMVGAGFKPAPTQNCRRHALPEIIRGFKTFSSRRVNDALTSPGAPLWQRNYYEHIIRNETELDAIRQYICQNPLNWEKDEEYFAFKKET